MGVHQCTKFKCLGCKSLFDKKDEIHRCAVVVRIREEKDNHFLSQGDLADGKKKALIVYDIESKFNKIQSHKEVITGFNLDSEGFYTDVIDYGFDTLGHEANMICFKILFHDDPTKVLYGKRCLEEFVTFCLSFNMGNNICIAHNASGYDGRLIFMKLGEFMPDHEVLPICRGTKFLQISVGTKLVFRDSLLHLPGSLKNLGKEFAPGMALKGFFPYLFNVDENQNYQGSIPDLEMFGTSYKSISERDALWKWHSEFKGDWNFKYELEKYCVNDVEILSKIVEEYHYAQIKVTGMTPWLHATTPAFTHYAFISELTKLLELPDVKGATPEYIEKIEKAAEEGFAVLKNHEDAFVMSCLRGGRTENKVFSFEISQEKIDRGCKVLDIDQVSMYPNAQMSCEFPYGMPEIFYWDLDFAPCWKHENKCKCRGSRIPKESKCVFVETQPTVEEILADDSFNGFACVTVIAPKDLPHAVLVRLCPRTGKCIASLADEDLIEIFVTVPELKLAFREGYKLVKIFRFDKYKFGPSPWFDFLGKLLMVKLTNSGPEPETDELKLQLM